MNMKIFNLRIFAILKLFFLLSICVVSLSERAFSGSFYSRDGIEVDMSISGFLSDGNFSKIGFALKCSYASAYLHPKGMSRGWSWPTDRSSGSFILVVANPGLGATFEYIIARGDALPKKSYILETVTGRSFKNGFIFFDPDETYSDLRRIRLDGVVSIDFSEEYLSFPGISSFVTLDGQGAFKEQRPHLVLSTLRISRETGEWRTTRRQGDLGGEASGRCTLLDNEEEAKEISRSLMFDGFSGTVREFNSSIVSRKAAPRKF